MCVNYYCGYNQEMFSIWIDNDPEIIEGICVLLNYLNYLYNGFVTFIAYTKEGEFNIHIFMGDVK